MGDANACDVAQETHEQITSHGGGLPEANKLEYGMPVPISKTWAGVYLDDYLVVHRAAFRMQSLDKGADLQLYARACAAVDAAELHRAPKKEFIAKTNFTSWGPKPEDVAG